MSPSIVQLSYNLLVEKSVIDRKTIRPLSEERKILPYVIFTTTIIENRALDKGHSSRRTLFFVPHFRLLS
jgi:hypothetical protein